ncbi:MULTISPECIES: 3'(2'),5'-bisphosphate nucleotidase CysQ [Azorhizobium]|uniref:3'(2'),5'-bisphosphate nucleotidase CysQ n=1 Tax=Azorhizobium TaxID=6 RepID=UPI00105D67FB|nr:3'(2'),5'-bisphosphate nucleotidase CysQ [Azorhizobium sp. AG788]TDT92713.1 3'(2'),5'-bisphosphate nucleotidase [Azorhizobium sp. AG788]
MTAPADLTFLAALARIALDAGAVIRRIEANGIHAREKADASVVTDADEAAEALICPALRTLAPGTPIIAEEAVAAGGGVAPGRRFFLVDPLDGTREFVSGNGEYTVNIALVEDGTPRYGIIYAPAKGLLYAGGDGAAFKALRAPEDAVVPENWTPIHCRLRPAGPIRVCASRSHSDPSTSAFIGGFEVEDCVNAGSALKFGLLAEGAVDLYPRLSPVMEWDSAAGHAIVVAAGGSVRRPDGSPLTYGHPENDFRVNGFIAEGRPVA